MLAPTIHLNGTSRDELLNQAIEAGHALQIALAALQEMSPNARDYYPQGHDAFRKASHEHEQRIGRVRDVLQEVTALVEVIAE